MTVRKQATVIFNADKPGLEVMMVYYDNVPEEDRAKYEVKGRKPSFIYDEKYSYD